MIKRPSARLILTGALAVTCGLSLLANVALLARGRHFERMFYLTRLDPLGLGAFGAAPDAPGEPRRVVFFGDSRAAAWPAPPLPGAQFVNRGVDGHSSAQALLRFDAHVAPLRPDVVVVQVGVNDLVALPLLREGRAEVVAGAGANIAAIVARARGLGAEVILTTVFPVGGGLWPDRSVQEAIGALNAALVALEQPGVRVLDSAAVLAGGDGRVRPDYAEDELHLSPAGYAALNAALLPLLGAAAPPAGGEIWP